MLATLRKRGPLTALELQDATGISATTIRRYLVPPAVTLLAVEWAGRGWTKRYVLTDAFCDCGQPVAYRLRITQLSADGGTRSDWLTLCIGCIELLDKRERRQARRVR